MPSSHRKSHPPKSREDCSVEQNKRKLVVECLLTKEELKSMCRERGLEFVDYEPKGEVEIILDHKCRGLQYYYLVKWKGYSFEYCSWISHRELNECKKLIWFYRTIITQNENMSKELFEYFVNDLLFREPRDLLTLKLLCCLVYGLSNEDINGLLLTQDELECKVKKITKLPVTKLQKISNNLMQLMKFFYERKKVLLKIQEWETEINRFTSPRIRVENQVDLELPPTKFKFIQKNISSTVDLNCKPVVFCTCENCGEECKACCSASFDSSLAYDRQGCLWLPPGYPIFECNDLCKCPRDCINRVIQHGQTVKVAVFRTSNGCGWGLKTLENISRGQYVMEYLGEVITSEEAEDRGEHYDYLGQSYLFDLDCSDECLYTIDGCHYGNASHFINHSCDPNMRVYSAYINQHNPHLPRLALFAKRRIRAGEELTFDYQMKDTRSKHGYPVPDEERVLCLCKSKNCKKYLF